MPFDTGERRWRDGEEPSTGDDKVSWAEVCLVELIALLIGTWLIFGGG